MLFVHSFSRPTLEHARRICRENALSEFLLTDQAALFASNTTLSKAFDNKDKVLFKGDNSATNMLKSAKVSGFDDQGNLLADGEKIQTPHAIIHIRDGHAKIACDTLATFPIFYYKKDETIIATDRLSIISQLIDQELDPVGFMEFMRFGFFVGDRSPLKNVRRLRAGEIICFSLHRKSAHHSTRVAPPWATVADSQPVYSKASVDEITELLLEATAVPDGSMLMMSAGWDSRTMLAAMLARGTKNILLYNHGGRQSREGAIVKKISRDFGLELTQMPLLADFFRPDRLEQYASNYDNVVFPHWHVAGSKAQQQGRPCVVSGVLGEVLGGHYGSPMLMAGIGKIAAVSLYLSAPRLATKLYDSKAGGHSIALKTLRQSPYQKPWYIRDEVWSSTFQEIASEVNADIQEEITFYQQHGLEAPEELLECYITNQRGTQYICAQIMSCMNDSVTLSIPFAHSRLMQISSQVPFQEKIHNKLNREIIKRLAPKLLNYPMAATLVPAKHPLLVQEGSRFVRRAGEQALWKAHRLAPSVFPEPNLGWANFQFMNVELLESVIDSLGLDVFDQAGMKHSVNGTLHAPRHPVWDMLGKMKTLDNMTQGSVLR